MKIPTKVLEINSWLFSDTLPVTYCHVWGGTRDENDGFWFGWLDLVAPWLQVLLIKLKYSAIADLYNLVLS
jgi:hypothetical protein